MKRLLLVYIGNEQPSWGNIAFSRTRHYYIMPGILYLAAVLRGDEELAATLDVETMHLNMTVQDEEAMFQQIVSARPDIVGFSLFCWNRERTLALAARYRETHPDGGVMLGGPEVGMQNNEETERFLQGNPAIDLLVFGEAESRIRTLVRYAMDQDFSHLRSTTGYAVGTPEGVIASYDITPQHELDSIPSPYPFPLEVARSRNCGLAMVYESSRGCPYKCIYCQFGHRSNTIRRFSLNRIERELQWLLSEQVNCIHFADPVFDMVPNHAKSVLNVLCDNNIRTSLLFYCSFYKLDEELAELLARSQCQIDVGVQSTNPNVLKKIKRGLSPRLFEDIAALLQRYELNFYTDLIFGLPGDSMDSFRASFNQTIGLGPAFMMLFPLTMIKRTELEQHAQALGMRRYDKDEVAAQDLMCDIQFPNITLYEAFGLDDLRRFDNIVLTCFYFYTRFRYTLNYMQQRSGGDAAWLYESIGAQVKEYLRRIGQVPSNTNRIAGFEDELMRIFAGLMREQGAGERELAALKELFNVDILRLLILEAPQREKNWERTYRLRQDKLSMSPEDMSAARFVTSTHGKVASLPYRLDDLIRLAELREEIVPHTDRVLIHAPFSRWNASVFSLSPLQAFLFDKIPTDRAVRYGSILSAARRRQQGIDEADLRTELRAFEKEGIVDIVR